MAEHNFSMQGTLGVLLASKKYSSIKDILVTMNPSDIAAVMNDLEGDQLPLIFRLLPKEPATAAFVEMDPDQQEVLIRGFSDKELKEVVGEMFVDDAADLIEEMPADVVQRMLASADPDKRREINEILKYPEDCAGSSMTTEFIALRPDMTVEEAIANIRQTAVDKETIYTCYVTDAVTKELLGYVTVKDLLLAKNANARIGDLMDPNVISVNTHTDQETVAQMLSKYNFLALPVVDMDNRMVGIVTFDDAMDIIEDEATEDIEIMGGMSPSEKAYLRATPFEVFRQRIPWLSLLMLSATFTGIIITYYENSLAAQIALTAFIPMLTGTGGNSGTQASVSVIRALALDELEFSDLPAVIWKEVRTAVLCGITLAAICFVKIMLVDRLMMNNLSVTPLMALAVCVSMALTVLVSKVVGCSLPILAKRVGFDPAVMASPLITTLVDALSLLVYFGVATAILA